MLVTAAHARVGRRLLWRQPRYAHILGATRHGHRAYRRADPLSPWAWSTLRRPKLIRQLPMLFPTGRRTTGSPLNGVIDELARHRRRLDAVPASLPRRQRRDRRHPALLRGRVDLCLVSPWGLPAPYPSLSLTWRRRPERDARPVSLTPSSRRAGPRLHSAQLRQSVHDHRSSYRCRWRGEQGLKLLFDPCEHAPIAIPRLQRNR